MLITLFVTKLTLWENSYKSFNAMHSGIMPLHLRSGITLY